mgnify:CR=1 FL=1
MINISELSLNFSGEPLFKDVNLKFTQGNCYGVIGANGAGKSTVLNTISGLLRAKSGTIDFMGTPINTMAPNKIVQLGLAQCPEGRRVFAHMTVEENLEMGAYTRPNSTIEGNLEHVYELFPRLKERRKQVGGTLSGGEQQMLAMGRALMSHPQIILMDEPSMGLSPIFVNEIFDIIEEVSKSGTTVLLVEQNAKKALSIADRAYVLETGNIVLDGKASELLDNDSIKKAYLGE